jgi:hypothetical protein
MILSLFNDSLSATLFRSPSDVRVRNSERECRVKTIRHPSFSKGSVRDKFQTCGRSCMPRISQYAAAVYANSSMSSITFPVLISVRD